MLVRMVWVGTYTVIEEEMAGVVTDVGVVDIYTVIEEIVTEVDT